MFWFGCMLLVRRHKLNHVSYVDGDGRQGNHQNKVCTEYENIYVGRFVSLCLSFSHSLVLTANAMMSIHVAVYGPANTELALHALCIPISKKHCAKLCCVLAAAFAVVSVEPYIFQSFFFSLVLPFFLLSILCIVFLLFGILCSCVNAFCSENIIFIFPHFWMPFFFCSSSVDFFCSILYVYSALAHIILNRYHHCT